MCLPVNKYEDDFEEEAEDQDRRHIIGLRADETRVNGKTISVDVTEKEKEKEKEGTLPEHRRVSRLVWVSIWVRCTGTFKPLIKDHKFHFVPITERNNLLVNKNHAFIFKDH